MVEIESYRNISFISFYPYFSKTLCDFGIPKFQCFNLHVGYFARRKYLPHYDSAGKNTHVSNTFHESINYVFLLI